MSICLHPQIIDHLCEDGFVYDESSVNFAKCSYPFSVDCSGRTELQPPKGNKVCPRLNGYFAHEDPNVSLIKTKLLYTLLNGREFLSERGEHLPLLAIFSTTRSRFGYLLLVKIERILISSHCGRSLNDVTILLSTSPDLWWVDTTSTFLGGRLF